MKVSLGCFGKLPIYNDFIELSRWRARGAELKRWLISGVALASRGDTGSPARTPPGAPDSNASSSHLDGDESSGRASRGFRFVWPVGTGRRLSCGVVWDGCDGVGRRFPFALHTEIARKALDIEDRSELPLVLDSLWAVLERRARTRDARHWTDLSPGEARVPEIIGPLARERFEFQPPGRAAVARSDGLGRRSARAWLEPLATEAWWVLWPRLLWRLAESARSLRAGDSSRALILPASSSLPSSLVASFWLRVLENGIGSAARLPPLTLWIPCEGAEADGIWIFHREPLASDFPPLFSRTAAHSYLEDLRQPAQRREFGDNPHRTEPSEAERAFVREVQERITENASAETLSGALVGLV